MLHACGFSNTIQKTNFLASKSYKRVRCRVLGLIAIVDREGDFAAQAQGESDICISAMCAFSMHDEYYPSSTINEP